MDNKWTDEHENWTSLRNDLCMVINSKKRTHTGVQIDSHDIRNKSRLTPTLQMRNEKKRFTDLGWNGNNTVSICERKHSNTCMNNIIISIELIALSLGVITGQPIPQGHWLVPIQRIPIIMKSTQHTDSTCSMRYTSKVIIDAKSNESMEGVLATRWRVRHKDDQFTAQKWSSSDK